MSPMVVEGYALIHQSALLLPKNKKAGLTTAEWRLRNYLKHPVDPGWETGRYCVCHAKFRNARTRRKGQFVLDVVRNDEGAYVVRSVFKISGITKCRRGCGTDLLFRTYYFADKRPIRVGIKPSPSGTKVRRMRALMREVRKHYTMYRAGQRPISISPQDWGRMISATRNLARCPTRR